MVVSKVEIVEENGELTNAIIIHDDSGQFTLFIDEYQRLRTSVREFRFVSETPIFEI